MEKEVVRGKSCVEGSEEGVVKREFRSNSSPIPWVALRSLSGDGGRDASDPHSFIEQSARSLSRKVGGLENVLFLFWQEGVDVTSKIGEGRGRVGRKPCREGEAAGLV
jgi:hypothetical protein